MTQFASTIGSDPIASGLPSDWTLGSGTLSTVKVAADGTAPSPFTQSFQFTSSASAAVQWTPPGSVGDQEVLCLFKFNSTVASSAVLGACSVRTTGSTNYLFVFSSTSTTGGTSIQLFQSSATQIATASFTWATTTWYWIRLNVTGTTITGKIWASGSAEPGSPQLSVTNSGVASGSTGFRASVNTSGGQSIAFFSAGTGGSAAPGPNPLIFPFPIRRLIYRR